MVYQKDLQISLKPLFSALLLFMILVYGIGPSITFAQSQNNPTQINPSILTKTPHPKISSNASTTPLPQLNATAPKSITNSSVLSQTPHPTVLSNSSK